MTTGDRPWFAEVDYLQAVNARGFLHASCCDHPPGHGETFRATMERQGYIVTRYTPAQLAALRPLPKISAREAADAKPEPVRPPSATEFPPVGTAVTLPEHGDGRVVTILPAFEGTGALVVRTRRGEHLARPGGWTLAPEPREDVSAAPKPVSTVVDAPTPPKATSMPNLFELELIA